MTFGFYCIETPLWPEMQLHLPIHTNIRYNKPSAQTKQKRKKADGMIHGSIKKIDLSTSIFERMIRNGSLYVDKTRMIENFMNESSQVMLITRQRRLGKSLNMDTLRCFLSSQQDHRHLFKGLYIESSPVWDMAHSAPVFNFNFKGLTAEYYEDQVWEETIKNLYSFTDPDRLSGYAKMLCNGLINKTTLPVNYLQKLTELAHAVTGKHAYLLIDEYDSLLLNIYPGEKYEEVRRFLSTLIALSMKDNPFLEKALITGVLRISYESLFSGLNNIKIFDMFGDDVFTNDYGLTEEEVKELCRLADLDFDKITAWYNGIRVKGQAIYSMYSTMYYIRKRLFDCYWGRSGNLEMITDLMTDGRVDTLSKLINVERVEEIVDNRVSLKQLYADNNDAAFYSLLVQGGYLSHEKEDPESPVAVLSIPNIELRQVWQKFILDMYYPSQGTLRTMFDRADDPVLFAEDARYFLENRLSYHDLAVYQGENPGQVHEKIYHIFIMGILSAYNDTRFKRPSSNRESGRGRYDILIEKGDAHYIFEFKAAKSEEDLENACKEALRQIDEKRYGTDLDSKKQLRKVGVAVFGKLCRVMAEY